MSNPYDDFHRVREDVVLGCPPPPGFGRYVPTKADWASYDEWLEQNDAANDYDERIEG